MHSSTTDASKTSGQIHNAKGSVKETLGKTFNAPHLAQSGRQEQMAGKTEVNAARGQGYAQGTGDCVEGKKDQMVGSITNDRSQQAHGNLQHSKGEAQQNFNRHL
ncbi:hypothetical protein BDQ12DRAFT_666475 [Crucibulum laeve]|uniref:CsbD-like domain-containing protein n=1 Tax=Crucibulum laeve TaxID=68775 RepID=A0A5C3LZY9_9AGAR|nr:hypothetical protein BDQ12DRAFT_666475 [Crucibulum laeve]